ncbi:hypothetical protein FJT64_023887 [Amphibalanus amphitrite]|uniref:Uncharacterized protein n=1 Tax=Amphibalanus amphitrite TaxID=1232801 RepID=A0A6A4WG86_AMPAM|nr:hypothetical protein FJT64_023887 [Amphibalanus amphitrite]
MKTTAVLVTLLTTTLAWQDDLVPLRTLPLDRCICVIGTETAEGASGKVDGSPPLRSAKASRAEVPS